jgi:hypothetical protein
MEQVEKFIEKYGPTMTATYTGLKRAPWGDVQDAWKCVLRVGGRRMQVTFYMGSGHAGRPPKIEDVLESLALDAALLEQSGGSIEHFTAETGGLEDPEDPSVIRDFKRTTRQTGKLADLLGEEGYRLLVFGEEPVEDETDG